MKPNMNDSMKKLCFFIMALMSVSCVMYSDKDDYAEPEFSIASGAYDTYIGNIFRSTELYLFFSGYQAIREDREEALKLMESYFGKDAGELYYEMADIYSWGTIYLTDTEGEYLYRTGRYFYGYDNEKTLISSDGERIVINWYRNDGLVLRAEVQADGERMKISSLDLSFSDDCGTDVSVSIAEPLEMDICSEGNYSYFPDMGSLKYVISGSVEDEFVVRYTGDGCVLDDGNGIETIYNSK